MVATRGAPVPDAFSMEAHNPVTAGNGRNRQGDQLRIRSSVSRKHDRNRSHRNLLPQLLDDAGAKPRSAVRAPIESPLRLDRTEQHQFQAERRSPWCLRPTRLDAVARNAHCPGPFQERLDSPSHGKSITSQNLTATEMNETVFTALRQQLPERVQPERTTIGQPDAALAAVRRDVENRPSLAPSAPFIPDIVRELPWSGAVASRIVPQIVTPQYFEHGFDRWFHLSVAVVPYSFDAIDPLLQFHVHPPWHNRNGWPAKSLAGARLTILFPVRVVSGTPPGVSRTPRGPVRPDRAVAPPQRQASSRAAGRPLPDATRGTPRC